MALLGHAESLVSGLPADLKRTLTQVLRYIVPGARYGPVTHQGKSESFQAYYLNSTSDPSTGEFSILHGLGRTPYLAQAVLPLDSSGGRLIPLTVTRSADTQRVYLKTEAGSTSAPFTLLVE